MIAGLGLLASAALAQPPVPVTAVEARLERIERRIEALGTLRARESVNITATVGERVVEVGFSDGDRVRQGQVLLRLEAREAEALLAEAQAAEEEARRQYDRARQLANRGAAAQAQLDTARREAETARARVAAVESRLANLIITAPFDGVVGLRNISVGAFVQPGSLVTTLDDDSVMLLDFTVPAVVLPSLAPGAKVEARSPGFENEKFVGKIRSVDSRVDPTTRSVMVRAEIENPQRRLKPGLLMMVEVAAEAREGVVIPESAVLRQGKETFALVISEQDPSGLAWAERRRIIIGERRAGKVEVLEGVEAGERVVAHGGFRVSDGGRVRVVKGLPPRAASPASANSSGAA